jgi:hypothetical protein
MKTLKSISINALILLSTISLRKSATEMNLSHVSGNPHMPLKQTKKILKSRITKVLLKLTESFLRRSLIKYIFICQSSRTKQGVT